MCPSSVPDTPSPDQVEVPLPPDDATVVEQEQSELDEPPSGEAEEINER